MPNDNPNPWLKIPAADYEGHMGSPEVGQLQLLNRRLKQVIQATRPESAAVLGCTTGNGFEHFDPSVTRHILGIDINPDYLEVARQRFADYGNYLDLICADLNGWSFGERRFDLIHGALVFEYVDTNRLLQEIARGLKPEGVLSVVLQLPVEGLPSVSKTIYASLEKLAPIFQHYGTDEFRELASQSGLEETQGEVETLPSGKQFYFGCYRFHLFPFRL
jgi:ubiquinone/menaquinone biosynthesis C-methylase UbiE